MLPPKTIIKPNLIISAFQNVIISAPTQAILISNTLYNPKMIELNCVWHIRHSKQQKQAKKHSSIYLCCSFSSIEMSTNSTPELPEGASFESEIAAAFLTSLQHIFFALSGSDADFFVFLMFWLCWITEMSHFAAHPINNSQPSHKNFLIPLMSWYSAFSRTYFYRGSC